MEKLPVICFGAGGHAGMLVEILAEHPQYQIVGLLDKDPALHGKQLHGVEVLGSDEMLSQLKDNGIHHFVVGIGATKSCALRKQVYEYAKNLGLQSITVIHKSALVMKSASIGEGSVVMPKAVINSNVKIACNVIINSAAVVEHDSVVGAHSHVATAACAAGGVTLGEAVMLGANATVREGVFINDHAVVGAGSVVVKNVDSGLIVVGSPAKEIVASYE